MGSNLSSHTRSLYTLEDLTVFFLIIRKASFCVCVLVRSNISYMVRPEKKGSDACLSLSHWMSIFVFGFLIPMIIDLWPVGTAAPAFKEIRLNCH